jgi:hypothetical protein
MGKAPTSDSIMSPGEMKPLLALSKLEPVQAAIGITGDGDGVILLHKKMKPKKVLATLKADAKKAGIALNTSSLRFGKAEVDTDYDPGMVRFFINKEAPGNMRIKLIELVKRIPYAKVEINVEPGLEDEPEEETDNDADGAAPASAESGGAKAAPVAAAQAPQAPPSVAAKPAEAGVRPDAGALTAELAALARRIPEAAGSDPAVKARLLKLASDTNVNIKTNNLNYAARFLAELRDALRDTKPSTTGSGTTRTQTAAGTTDSSEPKHASPVALEKSRTIWEAQRKKLVADIVEFKNKVIAKIEDDPESARMIDALDQLDDIPDNLDDRLLGVLGEGIEEQDPKKRAKLVDEARELIAEYENYVETDPLIVALGAENPLGVILTAGAEVTGTLKALSAVLH